MIIYLHGFLSSPASGKVRLLAKRLAERGLSDALWCGQLPVAPREAIATVEQALAEAKTPPTLVGSSLGGYYATYLAERHGLRAVLINPAVDAPRTLAEAVGIQRNYHTGEACEFTTEHLAQLRELDVPQPTRQGRYWSASLSAPDVPVFASSPASVPASHRWRCPPARTGCSAPA